MSTFLDLLIVVVMALLAVSLVLVALMFLVKNRKVKRACFYAVAALGVYLGTVGVRILWPGFMPQVILAVALAMTSIAALVLHLRKKDNEKLFLYARIAASVALVVGFFNAFL